MLAPSENRIQNLAACNRDNSATRPRQFCRSTCTRATSGFVAAWMCGHSACSQVCRLIRDRICPVIPGCHRRQNSSLLLVELNRLFDNLTKFGEYSLLVITMTTTEEQARATADKAVVLIRPFDNFYVPRRLIHDWDCSMHQISSRDRSRLRLANPSIKH